MRRGCVLTFAKLEVLKRRKTSNNDRDSYNVITVIHKVRNVVLR